MIANSRGSKRLTGAASLRNRIPAIFGPLAPLDIAQRIEQQPQKLSVAGSTPAFQPCLVNRQLTE